MRPILKYFVFFISKPWINQITWPNIFLKIWKIQQKTVKNVFQLYLSENFVKFFRVNYNYQSFFQFFSKFLLKIKPFRCGGGRCIDHSRGTKYLMFLDKIWCFEYVKNSFKIPRNIVDLENWYFQVKFHF